MNVHECSADDKESDRIENSTHLLFKCVNLESTVYVRTRCYIGL